MNIFSSSSSNNSTTNHDNTHFKPIQHPDVDLFPPPNSPSICPSPTNSTCSSSSSVTFTPISPASTTSSSSTSFLLLPTNPNRSNHNSLIAPAATKTFHLKPKKFSHRHQLQRDRSLDEAATLQPLSVLLPTSRDRTVTSTNTTTMTNLSSEDHRSTSIPEQKSIDSTNA